MTKSETTVSDRSNMQLMNSDALGYETAYVPTPLSDEQKLQLSSTIIENLKLIGVKEAEMKAIVAGLKAEIKTLKSDIAADVNQHDKGYYEREVRLELIPDFQKGIMEYLDTTSGEIVAHKTRPLTPSERQLKIKTPGGETLGTGTDNF